MNSKVVFIFLVLTACLSCGKKKQEVAQNTDSTATSNAVCKYDTATVVSYSATVKTIITSNCSACHSSPGAGGINLDTYQQCKQLAQSGDLMRVTSCSPGDVCMPPPPNKSLDSCSMKALKIWIKAGMPN